MLLTNQNDSGDKISQIDVFNLYGRGDSVFASAGTLEKKTYYSNYLKLMEPSFETYRSGAFLNGEPANPDEYHTYGVEWTEDYVRFFLDGVSYGTVELTADKYKDLRTEMYIDFIGGVNLTELTANDEECNWPINLDVDWVRVYQKPDGVRTDRIEAAAKAEAEANKKAEAKK
jgi:beta-glucanase (GH16 family)